MQVDDGQVRSKQAGTTRDRAWRGDEARAAHGVVAATAAYFDLLSPEYRRPGGAVTPD